MPEHRRRTHHRLPAEAYREPGRVFSVTIGTSPKQPVFADVALGESYVALLRELRDKHQAPVYAFCLMPDHAHLLLGVAESTSLSKLIQEWKSRCYHARRQTGRPEKFWQRGFYDRALRDSEDVREVALYILNNPVRAGLVEDFRQYPLSGSLEWDLK